MKNVIAVIRYRNGATSYSFIPHAQEGFELYDSAKADWERDDAQLLGLFPIGEFPLLKLLFLFEDAAQAKDASTLDLLKDKLIELYEDNQDACLPLLVADIFEAGRKSATCG